jgi:hypothetical protein
MPLTSLTAQSSSTSSSTTINAPATVNAGDLLVMWDFSRGNPAPADVVPNLFTRITPNTFTLAGDHRAVASYKIADGTEDGAAITGMTVGASGGYKAMYLFRGDKPIVSVTPGSVANESTTGNPAAQTVASGSGLAPLIVFGCYGTSGTVNPRTFTVAAVDAKDGEITPNVRCYLAYKIYMSSPADVVVDMDDEGSNGLGSFYLSVQSAPASLPPFHRPPRFFTRRF